jgi:hypothetical protein
MPSHLTILINIYAPNNEIKSLPDRYNETIENTKNAEKSPHEVVNSFLDWIKEYTANMKNVHLITDNTAFDAGILRCFSSVDILYIFGDYRDIIDVSNIYYGIGREPITVDLLDKSSKKCALAGLGNRFKIPDLGVKKDHHPEGYWFNMGTLSRIYQGI